MTSPLGLLRLSIAIVWIATALLSAWMYPVGESLALLAPVGLTGTAALITVFLPEQWLHPYGPVLENLPLLAAVLLLREGEPA